MDAHLHYKMSFANGCLSTCTAEGFLCGLRKPYAILSSLSNTAEDPSPGVSDTGRTRKGTDVQRLQERMREKKIWARYWG